MGVTIKRKKKQEKTKNILQLFWNDTLAEAPALNVGDLRPPMEGKAQQKLSNASVVWNRATQDTFQSLKLNFFVISI